MYYKKLKKESGVSIKYNIYDLKMINDGDSLDDTSILINKEMATLIKPLIS